MFIIEQLVAGEWVCASSHTQIADRDAQWSRLTESGVPSDQLRTVDPE